MNKAFRMFPLMAAIAFVVGWATRVWLDSASPAPPRTHRPHTARPPSAPAGTAEVASSATESRDVAEPATGPSTTAPEVGKLKTPLPVADEPGEAHSAALEGEWLPVEPTPSPPDEALPAAPGPEPRDELTEREAALAATVPEPSDQAGEPAVPPETGGTGESEGAQAEVAAPDLPVPEQVPTAPGEAPEAGAPDEGGVEIPAIPETEPETPAFEPEPLDLVEESLGAAGAAEAQAEDAVDLQLEESEPEFEPVDLVEELEEAGDAVAAGPETPGDERPELEPPPILTPVNEMEPAVDDAASEAEEPSAESRPQSALEMPLRRTWKPETFGQPWDTDADEPKSQRQAAAPPPASGPSSGQDQPMSTDPTTFFDRPASRDSVTSAGATDNPPPLVRPQSAPSIWDPLEPEAEGNTGEVEDTVAPEDSGAKPSAVPRPDAAPEDQQGEEAPADLPAGGPGRAELQAEEDRVSADGENAARALIEEGNSFYELQAFELAEHRYSRAIAAAPEFVDAYYNRANARVRLNDIEGALADFDRALELFPDDPDALNNRGMLRLSAADSEKALKDFESAATLRPNDSMILVNLAVALTEAHRYAEALETFERATELDPQDPAAHYGAARAAMQVEQSARALDHASKALALDASIREEMADDPLLRGLRSRPEFQRILESQ